MLEIDTDFWINPDTVTAIKGAGEGKAVIFFWGENALGGHVVDRDARELSEDIAAHLGQDVASVFDGGEPEEEDESAAANG